MELPRYIQLDFLFVVLGVILVWFMNYFFFKSEKPISDFGYLYLIFYGTTGIFFFVFGIHEMMKNYDRDNKLQNLRVKKEEAELKRYLNRVKK